MPELSRIESIFLAAREHTSPAERAAYLDGACGDQAELRSRVEALLAAEPVLGGFLDPTAAVDSPLSGTSEDTVEVAGRIIAGKYRLLEQLGEGGMGEVWIAEQLEPVRRRVAIKLIKPGMDSRAVLARFEAERQALALMDHQNIAKVLDAGTTGRPGFRSGQSGRFEPPSYDAGRPYFVMELVKGTPITQFCDERKLSTHERLGLFVSVCQAIQHAHQKGIIHRDIKPTNVLVALHDEKPVPKVIDFGVAKAIGQQLTEKTLYTQFGVLMGTPAYMAPEQATFTQLDIDTRADIYALGVLLYELLAGGPPFELERLKKAALDEVLRLVREEEPPRPSQRLFTSQAKSSIAAVRQSEPARLTKLLRGELDWVVMKALEKDRNRRYETANGFARDLQRYLAGEAVQAVPPSTRYRLRKFVRKHRAELATVTGIALLLVAGVAVSTWQAVRATRAEAAARSAEHDALTAQAAEAARAEGERIAKQEAQTAAAAEKKAREQAQKRLAQIEKGNKILTSVFADLDIGLVKAGTEPLEAVLAQRLVKAAEQLEGEAVGDLLAVAGLQNRLGRSLLSLGYPREAIPLFVKARDAHIAKLGAEHDDTLASTNSLAMGYWAAGQFDRALPLYEETLKLRRAKLGAAHSDTLNSMNTLALVCQAAGQLDRALPLYEETLKLRKAKLSADHPDTLTSMANLALGYRAAGLPDRALPLYEQAFELSKSRWGADHSRTLTSMANLAEGCECAGQLDRALALYEETFNLTEAKLGADHSQTLANMACLARGYHAAGQLGRAMALYEEALTLRKAKLGADHPHTLTSMNSLAMCYLGQGQLDRALELCEETLKLRKARLGTNHPDTLTSMSNLAMGYLAHGKLDRALTLEMESLKLRKAKLGSDHPDTLMSLNNLAFGYQFADQPDRALPLFQEAAVGIELRVFHHEHAGRIVGNLIACHERLRQFEQAEAWRRKWLAVVKERSSADSLPIARELTGLGSNLLQQGKWIAAEAALRECLNILEKKEPDSWTTFNAKSMLGTALVGRKKYSEAEPLLVQAYSGMKLCEMTIPRAGSVWLPDAVDLRRGDLIGSPPMPVGRACLSDAVDRLIELYTALDELDQVKKWQAERTKYPEVSPPPREK